MIDQSGNALSGLRRSCVSAGLAIVLSSIGAFAQTPRPPAAPETTTDRLGRTTPKGTVEGFLGAARRGEDDLARQYLNTRQTGEAGAALAHQLFVVLDRRMRGLPELSDAPEGSANPDSPGLEIIGSVESVRGRIDIVLEQQQRADGGLIWLFSRATLQAVPSVHEEIVIERSLRGLPPQLTNIRVGGILLIEWGVMVVALAAVYPVTRLLNRALTALVRRVRREAFERSSFAKRGVVSAPVRLILLAIACRILLQALPFSLLSRQFWATPSAIVGIVCTAWLAVLSTARSSDPSSGASPQTRRPQPRWPASSGGWWICS